MGRTKKRKTAIGIAVTALVICAVFLRAVTQGRRDEPYFLPLSLLRSFIYISLMACWGVSVRQRIVQTQVRRYLTALSLLCVFWLSIRTVKYFFVSDANPVRYLWYLYYFPMLFIPLLCVFVAFSLWKPENYRLPKLTSLLYIPTVALLLLVLTNDLHQLVFSFPQDAVVWADTDHTYGSGYFAVMGFIALGMGTAIITMLLKCRVPRSHAMLWLPFVPVGLAALYTVLYVAGFGWLRDIAGDMTVVQCLLLSAGIECCTHCGLIQSNEGYLSMFEATTIRAEITDENCGIQCASASSTVTDIDTLRRAAKGTVRLDKNTLLKSSPIRGGFVFWQEDISAVQNALDELLIVQEELRDTGDILKEEMEQKARYFKLVEQNRLYDMIERQSAPQLRKLQVLLSELSNAQSLDGSRELLGKTAVLMTYIKRRSNLVFLSAREKAIDAGELSLCLNESIQSLKLCDAHGALYMQLEGSIPVSAAIKMYDLFVIITDRALGAINTLLIFINANDAAFIMNVSLSSTAGLYGIASAMDGLNVERDEDGIWHFMLKISREGA